MKTEFLFSILSMLFRVEKCQIAEEVTINIPVSHDL